MCFTWGEQFPATVWKSAQRRQMQREHAVDAPPTGADSQSHDQHQLIYQVLTVYTHVLSLTLPYPHRWLWACWRAARDRIEPLYEAESSRSHPRSRSLSLRTTKQRMRRNRRGRQRNGRITTHSPFWMMACDLEYRPWMAAMWRGVLPSLLWKISYFSIIKVNIIKHFLKKVYKSYSPPQFASDMHKCL